MLRRNPLAALSLQQPSLRTPSLQLADDMPFELDKEGDADSPDGTCMHHLTLALLSLICKTAVGGAQAPCKLLSRHTTSAVFAT